ncbi:medium-chain fatty acid-CoA ligase faa2 [Coemansia erecta]|nr:medium-chain fatty acid-CoA ligase faa2 [Coemansia erecta]
MPVEPAVIVAAAVAVVASAVYFYYFASSANQPDLHPLQMAQQAAVSELRESAHETAVYRSKLAAHGSLLLATPGRIADLRELARAGRSTLRTDAMLTVVGETVTRISTEQTTQRVCAVAGALSRMCAGRPRAALIVLPGSTDFAVVYQACIEAGVAAIVVAAAEPIANIKTIAMHAQAQVLVTTAERALEIVPALGKAVPSHVVVAGGLGDSTEAQAVGKAATVAQLGDLEQGAPLDTDVEIAPTDPAYVLYSIEGSKPHGVVVTHANAVAAVAGLQASVPPAQALSRDDVFMLAAPASSATNLALLNVALLHGCAVALNETTDAEVFASQAFEARPTVTYVPPALARDMVQLFYTSTLQYPPLERRMFNYGYRRIVDSLRRGVWPRAGLWHLLYFRHYRSALGSRLRLMYVDARTTSTHSLEWLRALHGARVVPVFGVAETAGVATAGLFFDYATALDVHHAGAPLACNELKLIDAPSAGLTADDSPNPRGAICVRGPNVCVERWNEPSAELRDGWLELPIYGEMLANAALSVLGSRSSVVRSSQSPSGTVFLEQLERVFASSSAVVNVCVVGRSSRLDVVVYPRPMELFAAAKRLKKEYRLNQIADYPWCADYMRDCLLEAARSEGVEWAAHADIRVNLVSVPFSLQNGFVLADGSNNRSAIQKSLDAKN